MKDEDVKPENGAPKKTRRGDPRKVTEKRLNNVALHYLARYSATADSLRKVLMRRVAASARAHGADPEEGAAWVEALIVKFRGLGYLDDRSYAENRAHSLLARGTSTRAVAVKLREKGVSADDIAAALDAAREDTADLDLAAAAALARRRRLGPYRGQDGRSGRREKDLAALARAGFGYDLARRVVDAENTDTLEAMTAQEDVVEGPRYVSDEI